LNILNLASVLGPLLFLTYINDIADNLEFLTRLFGDDISLSYSSYSYKLLETKINSNLVKTLTGLAAEP